MRADRRPAGERVGAPCGGQRLGELRLGGERRHMVEPILDRAGEGEAGAGKRPPAFGAGMIEPLHRLAPGRRHRDTLRRHHLFEGGKPRRIGRPIAEKPARSSRARSRKACS